MMGCNSLHVRNKLNKLYNIRGYWRRGREGSKSCRLTSLSGIGAQRYTNACSCATNTVDDNYGIFLLFNRYGKQVAVLHYVELFKLPDRFDSRSLDKFLTVSQNNRWRGDAKGNWSTGRMVRHLSELQSKETITMLLSDAVQVREVQIIEDNEQTENKLWQFLE